MRIKTGLRQSKPKGQVSLEAAVAVIIAILLFLGAAYIFVWLNKCMVERQEHYKAGTDYTPEPLNIFNKTD